MVFPIPVGVFLRIAPVLPVGIGRPYASGSVSKVILVGTLGQVSSPLPWGCFHGASHGSHVSTVFPTPVGVFLLGSAVFALTDSLPHIPRITCQARLTANNAGKDLSRWTYPFTVGSAAIDLVLDWSLSESVSRQAAPYSPHDLLFRLGKPRPET